MPILDFDYYCQLAKVSNTDVPTFEQARNIFLFSVADFLRKDISLEQLSNIANGLYLKFPKSNLTLESQSLVDAIYSCSRLSYCIRCIHKGDNHKNDFFKTISEVMNYFEEYKNFSQYTTKLT